MIDAIVRQSRHQNKDKDVYAGRFEANLHMTATHLFKSSRNDQVCLSELILLRILLSARECHDDIVMLAVKIHHAR